jgi:hypothetical protein
MSVSYKILIDKNGSVPEVKSGLEQIINARFELSENWEYYDIYYLEIMGLWVQFYELDNAISRRYNQQFPELNEEYSQYTYKIQVRFLGDLIDPVDGKPWVRCAIVELARMINRNMKCNCLVFAEDVVTHSFSV